MVAAWRGRAAGVEALLATPGVDAAVEAAGPVRAAGAVTALGLARGMHGRQALDAGEPVIVVSDYPRCVALLECALRGRGAPSAASSSGVETELAPLAVGRQPSRAKMMAMRSAEFAEEARAAGSEGDGDAASDDEDEDADWAIFGPRPAVRAGPDPWDVGEFYWAWSDDDDADWQAARWEGNHAGQAAKIERAGRHGRAGVHATKGYRGKRGGRDGKGFRRPDRRL
jgi:hypothetical protein